MSNYKTFGELQIGDYIYVLDLSSGFSNKLKIHDKEYSIANTVCFYFHSYDPLWFDRDKTEEYNEEDNIKYIADENLI